MLLLITHLFENNVLILINYISAKKYMRLFRGIKSCSKSMDSIFYNGLVFLNTDGVLFSNFLKAPLNEDKLLKPQSLAIEDLV